MQKEINTIYGKKLKLLRINQFLSQTSMALKFKVTQQSYSDLEKGKTNFNVKRIEKICKIFNIPVDEFVTINKKTKKKTNKNMDSYNIKALKIHYERLLLEKEIRIGKLEIELMHHKPIKKPTKQAKEIVVMA